MITTTYKCDKCGHEQGNAEQMWTIEITFRHGYGSRPDYTYPEKSALWCRPCIESVGFLPFSKPLAHESERPNPTIEELIREIVRSEISA